MTAKTLMVQGTASSVEQRIRSRRATVGVIGLGYVGVTVAAALADAGFRVTGVDLDAARVARINAGESPLGGNEPGLGDLVARVVGSGRLVATGDYAALAGADVVLVAVDTPVADDRRPRYVSLLAACDALGRVMKRGVLVIVESTVAPGTCDDVVGPALERASGLRMNDGFSLGHCPERVMPGRLLRNLRELPRVCGGSSAAISEAMVALYESIVRGRLEASDCVTAELVKTAENAYRDVGIAFANELGTICEAVGADFRRVRELVNQSPGRHVLFAGAGVGGHCIPKDPWLLAHAAHERTGAVPRLLAAARDVNDAMPLHVARLVEDALDEAGVALEGARVLVCGYAYLEESDDERNSPSAALVAELEALGAHVVVHDPWIERYRGDLHERARGAAAVVLMVAHAAYRELDLARLRSVVAAPVLVDGRFLVEGRAAREAGFVFRGLGRGGRSG